MTWFSPGSGPGPGAERWLAEMRQDEEEANAARYHLQHPDEGDAPARRRRGLLKRLRRLFRHRD
jgi:hypothetical protein